VLVLGEDYCDDDVAGRHSDRADDEDGLTAEFVDVSYGWHGCEPHDDTDYTTCEEGSGVARETQLGEDLFHVSSHSCLGRVG